MDTPAPVSPSNALQRANWDGPAGRFWADNADRFDEGVAGYRPHVMAAADVSASSRVLDVGCGSGQVTRDAARTATSGSALGVDLSSDMVALARHRARLEDLTNVSFEQADAQIHPFPDNGFDIAVSRHGAMFFGDPVAAFANIGRAMRPGSRLVLLTWQAFDRQEWLRSFLAALGAGQSVSAPPPDEPSPFALSDPARVRRTLLSAGFADVTLEGLTEAMSFGSDVEDALAFVTGQHAGMLDRLDATRREQAVAELRADLGHHLGERGVCYESAAWLVRAHRP